MATPLFDFQVNGFAGVDFQRDDLTAADWAKAAAALRSRGVGSIFVTFITSPIDSLCRRFAACERVCAADPSVSAMIAGYHLEGPWLSPEPGYCGAHPPSAMGPPKLADWERLQAAAGGKIRLVTLAPELPGSAEMIAQLVRGGVHVSLGHTNAGEADIDLAIAAGARFATHLGNGCALVMHRHDNIVNRLLARDELIACLIPDGIHLPPFVLQNYFRAKPAGKVLFTTDCMAGAGAPPGRFTIGQLVVEIGVDRVVRQPGGGGFAGSALSPDDGVKSVASYLGLSEAEARKYWSEYPRAAFGVP